MGGGGGVRGRGEGVPMTYATLYMGCHPQETHIKVCSEGFSVMETGDRRVAPLSVRLCM